MSDDRHSVGTVSEAYRRLRSTIKFYDSEQPIRSVLVVDIDRTEPSDVPAWLSAAFASAGDSCLLVHTDVRGSSTENRGLSDLIAGDSTLAEACQRDYADRRGIVAAGTLIDADLVVGDGFETALTMMLDDWSYVVLSSAALPTYGDALALAPRVDAVILVITAGLTRRPLAIEAREALERVGARVLGVVMIEQKRRWF